MTWNHDQVHASYPEQTSEVHVPLPPSILSFRLHSRLCAEQAFSENSFAVSTKPLLVFRIWCGIKWRCCVAIPIQKKANICLSSAVTFHFHSRAVQEGNNWWLYTVVCRFGNNFLMKHEVHLALSAFLCFHTTLETTGPTFFCSNFFGSVFIGYGNVITLCIYIFFKSIPGCPSSYKHYWRSSRLQQWQQ